MRFLLVNNHCISDPTAGITQSLLTIMRWLAEAGHACHVLTTGRFEASVSFTVEEHLRQLGLELPNDDPHAPATVVSYAVVGVPVTLLLTRHNDEARPDPAESRRFLALFDDLLRDFDPDQVIASNAHPMILSALRQARRLGITTAFAVRGFGYYDTDYYFENVDHVFTCSSFLSAFYREKVGLESTPLEPPIDWSQVVATSTSRAFVTFVHPALHKGVLLFARVADMLGSRRPDIPVLVVQSATTAGVLNSLPGVDFSRYPQIMASPPVATPAGYFALTRILLVPSVWQEPFGRVAAEAMINAIPPVVSNRGGLPQVVRGEPGTRDGGFILPVPEWMTPETVRIPEEHEVDDWYRTVCSLWDDPAMYDSVAARAREIADERYAEVVSRQRHVEYFTALRPGKRVIRTASAAPRARKRRRPERSA